MGPSARGGVVAGAMLSESSSASGGGDCPIFCLKPLEYLHLTGTHCLCSSELITSEIIAIPNLLLDGALNIAERELRITQARPRERVTQEAQPVGIGGEPRFIESSGIVMRVMRCTA